MSRSLPLIVSLAVNALLSLWLVNNYFYDQPFRDYVQITLGQIYPFLVLTIGVGGGSGLGYLFLKRKPTSDQRISGKFPRGRLPSIGLNSSRTNPTLSKSPPSTNTASSTSGQMPRQVAYQVPPPISSKSSSTKSGPSPSNWTVTGKPTAPAPSSGQNQGAPQLIRRDSPQVITGLTTSPKKENPGPQVGQPQPSLPRQSAQPWRPESLGGPTDQNKSPAKPEADFVSKPQPQSMPFQPTNIRSVPGFSPNIDRQAVNSGPGSSIPPVPQKWQPPTPPQAGQSQVGPEQPRQDFDPSQKWAPVRPFPQQPSQSPPTQSPLRGPSGAPQGQARPLPPGPFTARPLPSAQTRPGSPPLYPPPGQGQPRPGPLAPVGVPRQFRPDQQQPRPMGPPPLRTPGQTNQFPTRPSGQWTPSGNQAQPVERSVGLTGQPLPRSADTDQKSLSPQGPASRIDVRGPEKSRFEGNASGAPKEEAGAPSDLPGPGAGSDMDWDTALDTILKTLRRDRIRDEQ